MDATPIPISPRTRACVLAALVCTTCVALWQFLTVRYNYGGNWTALYCAGATGKGPPAELASENIYRFADRPGYDGQVYHYIAHDPLFRRGFAAYADSPTLRYRRILVPGLAHLLAWGQDRWVDRAYLAVLWISVFAGAFWLSRLAVAFGRHPLWGLGFAAVPAVPVSADRLTVDATLAALTLGFVWYTSTGYAGARLTGRDSGTPHLRLYAVLALACLTRETGLLLVAAYGLYLIWERRLGLALLFCSALLPAFAWYTFVAAHAEPYQGAFLTAVPFSGYVDRLLHPMPYPGPTEVRVLAQSFDLLALAAVPVSVFWGLRRLRGNVTPVTIAICLFALLAAVLTKGDPWSEVYAFGRTLTPLLVLAALDGVAAGSMLPLLAMLAILPRIGLQFGSQILGVAKGLFG